MRLWLLVLLLLLGACASRVAPEPDAAVNSCPSGQPLQVISHGWHTGLAFAAAPLNARLPALAARFPEADFYEIGWGDAGFYQADEIGAGLALQAMLWSPGSVLHVVGLTRHPAQRFAKSEVRTLQLTPAQFARLLDFIQARFAVNEAQQLQPLGPGLYDDSQFYRATGRYHLFYTCNSWTAEALQHAGLELGTGPFLRAAGVMAALPVACR